MACTLPDLYTSLAHFEGELTPPCLDIYVATNDRSLACIERFLMRYAALSSDSVRDDFEVRPTGAQEGFVSGTLTSTLAYGLAQPDRAFTLYFHQKYPAYRRPMLYFSPHGRLLLGLSVEEETPEGVPNDAAEEIPEGVPNDAAAEQLLQLLKQEFHTQYGLVAFELPPEEADEEFEPIIG